MPRSGSEGRKAQKAAEKALKKEETAAARTDRETDKQVRNEKDPNKRLGNLLGIKDEKK